jgi:DNA-binding transcriptional LysR family regulator
VDLHQLKTFITVAREGSITRAAGLLHLSQPAVSAHIKAMEDALGVSLFERNPRGMSLTKDGQRLLVKAERTVAAHADLLAEAARSKGELTGKLRLGAGSNSSHEAIGRLLTGLAQSCPGVEVNLRHQSSREVLDGLRAGRLDAGLYNEPEEAPSDLVTVEVAQFSIHLVAAPGVVAASRRSDWKLLSELPWIYATESACCSRTAERLFSAHRFKPKRVISADRQEVTQTLLVSGMGVGLLHHDAATAAARRGDLELIAEAEERVRVLFAYLPSRAQDPVLIAASRLLLASE